MFYITNFDFENFIFPFTVNRIIIDEIFDETVFIILFFKSNTKQKNSLKVISLD